MTEKKPKRIAKVLARAGVASRREVERMIKAGRVKLNGRKLDTPAVTVTARDAITVDGKPVGEPERTRVWRYHKPVGLVTSARDEKGRKTVFDALPGDMPRVISIGRLDITSEGLLLLTNDGELARLLELPKTGWSRRYRVRLYGRIAQDDLYKLKNGVTIDGFRYGPIAAIQDRIQKEISWATVTLKEGKNREIRKVMEHLGCQVTRLIRLSYGPFQLGNLEAGKVEQVPARVLREQAGVIYPPLNDGQ